MVDARCKFQPINEAQTEFRCEVCRQQIRTGGPTRPEEIYAICEPERVAIGGPEGNTELPPPPPGTPQRPHGPGWYLHQMIRHRTGEDFLPGCGCQSWMGKMDEWGPAETRRHMPEIVAKMVSEAASRGWNLSKAPVMMRLAGAAARSISRVPGGSWATTKAAKKVCARMVELSCLAAEAETKGLKTDSG